VAATLKSFESQGYRKWLRGKDASGKGKDKAKDGNGPIQFFGAPQQPTVNQWLQAGLVQAQGAEGAGNSSSRAASNTSTKSASTLQRRQSGLHPEEEVVREVRYAP